MAAVAVQVETEGAETASRPICGSTAHGAAAPASLIHPLGFEPAAHGGAKGCLDIGVGDQGGVASMEDRAPDGRHRPESEAQAASILTTARKTLGVYVRYGQSMFLDVIWPVELAIRACVLNRESRFRPINQRSTLDFPYDERCPIRSQG